LTLDNTRIDRLQNPNNPSSPRKPNVNPRTYFRRQIAPLFAACCLAAPAWAEPAPAIDQARQAELVRLVRQDCGSCHGLTLQGGLGPALLPATLAGKPSDSLAATILHGRPGSAMPPWRRFLNEAEADWIVSNLKKGFPHER
jgi:cytochrome c55X